MTRQYGPYFEGTPIRETNPRGFPARYQGTCSICMKTIKKGAMMARAPDDAGWAHLECVEQEEQKERSREQTAQEEGGQTYMTYDGEWFVWRSPPDKKHLVDRSGAGFMWRGFAEPGSDRFPYKGQKVWITNKKERAHRVREYADAKALKALEDYGERIEEATAEDADVSCPAPSGFDYFPFQRAGISALLKRPKALLADEMGLGKTIQFIGMVNCLPKAKRVLVIVPAHLVLNWRDEAYKWLVGDWTVWVPASKQDKPPQDAERLFVVVNYDKLAGKTPPPLWHALMAINWDVVGADEAHYVKNKKAQRTQRVMGKNVKRGDRWVNEPGLADETDRLVFMTGTPIPNKVIEIQGMLSKLHPQFRKLGFKGFARRYAGGRLEYPYRGARKPVWVFGEPENLDELQEKMKASVMIRRLKRDVLKELPPKTRQIITISNDDLNAKDRSAIKREQKQWQKLVEKHGEEAAYNMLVAEMLKPTKGPAFDQMSKVRSKVAQSKAPYVARHVADMLANGVDKILVFTHHHEVTDTIVEKLTGGKDPALEPSEIDVYDGRITDKEKRKRIEKRFQSDPGLKVLVISIGAGGTGLTLTASNHVVFAEFPWRPSDVTQAEDRTHRIGQRENVLVQHIVLEGTLDARMVATIVKKQSVADKTLDDSTGASVSSLQGSVSEREEETKEAQKKAEKALEEWRAKREERIATMKVDRAMSSRDVEDMAERADLTPEQISAVGEAMVELAALDPDRARERNDVGFNASDGALGHSLAMLYRTGAMTSREAFLGAWIGYKYWKQIGQERADVLREIVGKEPMNGEKASTKKKAEPPPAWEGVALLSPKEAAFVEDMLDDLYQMGTEEAHAYADPIDAQYSDGKLTFGGRIEDILIRAAEDHVTDLKERVKEAGGKRNKALLRAGKGLVKKLHVGSFEFKTKPASEPKPTSKRYAATAYISVKGEGRGKAERETETAVKEALGDTQGYSYTEPYFIDVVGVEEQPEYEDPVSMVIFRATPDELEKVQRRLPVFADASFDERLPASEEPSLEDELEAAFIEVWEQELLAELE